MDSDILGGQSRRGRVRAVLESPTFASVAFLVVVVIVGAAVAPDFTTTANLKTTLNEFMAPSFVALGASLAMYAAIVDLSIGSSFALGAMVFAWFAADGYPLPVAVAIGIASGVGVGAVNGLVAVRFGVRPIVATLGMFVAARGLVRVIGSGRSVGAYYRSLFDLVDARIGPVPVLVIVSALLFAASWFWIEHARPGRHVVAVGGNDLSSRRAGIGVDHIRWLLLIGTGGLAAAAGVMQAARIGSAPVSLGVGLELQVYAAVLIGGYRFAGGGSGNPVNVLVSFFSLTLVLNILRLTGKPLALQDVVVGAAILVAVLLDIARSRSKP